MKKTRKIKVLLIIHSLHPGGAEEVVVHIANNIDKNRFDVKVYCIKELGVLADRLKKNGIPVTASVQKQGIRYLQSYYELKNIIKEFRPDIINTHSDPALINIGPVCMLNKCPSLVHTYHFGNYPHVKKRYLYAQMLFARFAKRLIAVSDSQREAIIKYHKVPADRISTLRNGVSHNSYLNDEQSRVVVRKEFGVGDDEILLGCIAVLSKQKGVVYLLDAASEILKRNSNMRIVIVGGGPLLQDLEGYAKDKNIGERLLFTGWRNDVMRIFPALDIFIQPSLWEAFSVVLLEAMASKVPIIATDVADNSQVIQHKVSGLIIPARNSAAIVDAVCRYASSMEDAKAMAEKSYVRYLENYTVTHMVKNYERLYDEMVSE